MPAETSPSLPAPLPPAPVQAYGAHGQPPYGGAFPSPGAFPHPRAFPQGAFPQGDGGALFRAQAEYEEQRRSLGVAYLLWFFLGAFGAHRFYLRRTGSAVTMLVLGLTVVGLFVTGFWALVDAFLIPGIATRLNGELRRDTYARYRVPLY